MVELFTLDPEEAVEKGDIEFIPDRFDSWEGLPVPGAGARRTATFAAMSMLLDPSMYEGDTLFAIEEPEMGLHPGLQRRVARTLGELAERSGYQVVLTTHSPIFIDAAGSDGIRLIRHGPMGVRTTESGANDLHAVLEAVGASPADVLLGERFLLVEGKADIAIIRAWAKKLGIDLDKSDLRLYATGGASFAATVASLVEVAYDRAEIVTLFDGDPAGRKAAEKVRERLGDRVERSLLDAEIESALSARAVREWATQLAAARGTRTPDRIEAPSWRVLEDLTKRLAGRSYDKVRDGEAIAAMMQPEEIPIQVAGLLVRLTVRD